MTFEVSLENNDPALLVEHWIDVAKWKADHGQIEAAIVEIDRAHEVLELDRSKKNL